MHRVPVENIMSTPAITIDPEALAADAAQMMEDNNIRRLPVIDEDQCVIGIVTDTDVLEAETAGRVLSSYEPDANTDWLSVADVMTREVVTITPNASIGELATAFMQHKVGGMPVTIPDDGNPCRQRLVGVVTETDIFRMIAEAWEREQS